MDSSPSACFLSSGAGKTDQPFAPLHHELFESNSISRFGSVDSHIPNPSLSSASVKLTRILLNWNTHFHQGQPSITL